MRPLTGPAETAIPVARPDAPREAGEDGSGFASQLAHAVGEVDRLQVDADARSSALAQGEGNLHETMLALEKADVAMRVALKVRTKVLDAYNEVMRMPV